MPFKAKAICLSNVFVSSKFYRLRSRLVSEDLAKTCMCQGSENIYSLKIDECFQMFKAPTHFSPLSISKNCASRKAVKHLRNNEWKMYSQNRHFSGFLSIAIRLPSNGNQTTWFLFICLFI